jgi:hypothetical protein
VKRISVIPRSSLLDPVMEWDSFAA